MIDREKLIEEMGTESADEAFFSDIANDIDDQISRIKIELPSYLHYSVAEKYYDIVIREVGKARKETAKQILDEVSKHFGGAWLAELYKKYGVEVDE